MIMMMIDVDDDDDDDVGDDDDDCCYYSDGDCSNSIRNVRQVDIISTTRGIASVE